MTGDRVVGELVEGSDLIKAGVDKLKDGTPVDPRKQYSGKKIQTFQINHHRQMKNLLAKGGEAAAIAYAQDIKTKKAEADAKNHPGN